MTDISLSPLPFERIQLLDTNNSTPRKNPITKDKDLSDDKNYNIRIFHAIPIIEDVNISINSKPLITKMKYGCMTSYYKTNTSLLNIKICSSTNTDAEIISKDIINENTGYFTLILYKNNYSYDVMVLNDSDYLDKDNLCSVRLINLIQNSGLLSLKSEKDKKLIEDIEYLESTNYLKIMPDDYRFSIISKHGELQKISTGDIKLSPNKSYSIYCLGTVDIPDSFLLLVYKDT